MNWSSEENIKITYRLLGVKGYGNVQANKILFAIMTHISDSTQFEREIVHSLKPEDIEVFDKPFELFQRDGLVRYMSILDDSIYPYDLKSFLHQNSPTVLSYMGNIDLLRAKKVGISGSRKVSEKGLWITKDCVHQLASDNVCIVSGYANGVDVAAHRTALECGTSTIIILPEGISSFYIRRELRDVWDWNKVLVISEFMPNDAWMSSRAMKRNLTIIGLSDVMIVVEAGSSGGSLDAGMKTIKAGKSLFVPLYKDVPESAVGNTILINQGAKSLKRNALSQRTNMDGIYSLINSQKQQTIFG